ncbi:translation initiation factor IF-2-like [Schistocerca piceifrons]|uniref:translation initiation factor IF-2-like n=1 Tax=Schistocerca piceifrons TaxID=274613 RepID=UPI001F5FB2E3|nr:translation initiation factor IF-2-like [Schistocerca piceifrons]
MSVNRAIVAGSTAPREAAREPGARLLTVMARPSLPARRADSHRGAGEQTTMERGEAGATQLARGAGAFPTLPSGAPITPRSMQIPPDAPTTRNQQRSPLLNEPRTTRKPHCGAPYHLRPPPPRPLTRRTLRALAAPPSPAPAPAPAFIKTSVGRELCNWGYFGPARRLPLHQTARLNTDGPALATLQASFPGISVPEMRVSDNSGNVLCTLNVEGPEGHRARCIGGGGWRDPQTLERRAGPPSRGRRLPQGGGSPRPRPQSRRHRQPRYRSRDGGRGKAAALELQSAQLAGTENPFARIRTGNSGPSSRRSFLPRPPPARPAFAFPVAMTPTPGRPPLRHVLDATRVALDDADAKENKAGPGDSL